MPVSPSIRARWQPPGGGYQGHNLVFLIGCPRSGTTWLQRLLASHPQVRTVQETFLFPRYISPQLRGKYSEVA
jgi:hypothetical protein